jgi:1-acyl-sn-glycerol-3-phosphate acyltransferase
MLAWGADVASRDRFDRAWAEAQAQSALGRAVTALPVRWFHAKLEGAERIPAGGGALLVGNHSFMGLDGFVLAALVNREAGRYLRFLGEKHLWDIPALGPILTRLGAVAGEPEVAVSMLEAGDLVAVYPGGIDDSWKPKAERYRLQWGHRAGFARVAIRAGVPIIPVAGLGIDDAYDVVGRERKLGRALFGSPRRTSSGSAGRPTRAWMPCWPPPADRLSTLAEVSHLNSRAERLRSGRPGPASCSLDSSGGGWWTRVHATI